MWWMRWRRRNVVEEEDQIPYHTNTISYHTNTIPIPCKTIPMPSVDTWCRHLVPTPGIRRCHLVTVIIALGILVICFASTEVQATKQAPKYKPPKLPQRGPPGLPQREPSSTSLPSCCFLAPRPSQLAGGCAEPDLASGGEASSGSAHPPAS